MPGAPTVHGGFGEVEVDVGHEIARPAEQHAVPMVADDGFRHEAVDFGYGRLAMAKLA
jgi:hypothetical protein